ncbi:anti-sigma factor domain-containing protein [Desulfofundulus thermosubterraneus]|uniref:Anti-sigma factor N-terminus n=1 Tax=Desulfofundulus thermosubterraneus DSM 16057 TaxID=1121432 RepID=A0A1M6H994_9FIRM|nr:anti-sigma factor domain-containing protein [Desulfofundulus thermosubterraneus]SHJ18810.1 Anti-sigma factor N-terminus [Desulfofundulus thermosubterraneus DSM 16057]
MVTGIVVEIKAKTCIILTPDAQFREIPLPTGGVRLGEEICYIPRRRTIFWQSLMAAACLLILLGAGLLYHGWLTQAVAYVSMDINPSVEMALDRREYVCEAKGLNAAGEILLSRAAVLGRPVEEAIATILIRAVQSNYLLPSQNNVVLTTITPKNGREPALQPGEIYQTIVKSLQSTGVPAEVVVETATPEIRRQARKLGLSTGRYLIHVEGSKKGLDIDLEELRREGMASLEKKKGIVIGEVLGKNGYTGWVDLPKSVSRPGPEARSNHRSPGLVNNKGLKRVSITEDKVSRTHSGTSTPVQKTSIPVKRVVPDDARGLPGLRVQGVPPHGNDQEHNGIKERNIKTEEPDGKGLYDNDNEVLRDNKDLPSTTDRDQDLHNNKKLKDNIDRKNNQNSDYNNNKATLPDSRPSGRM